MVAADASACCRRQFTCPTYEKKSHVHILAHNSSVSKIILVSGKFAVCGGSYAAAIEGKKSL